MTPQSNKDVATSRKRNLENVQKNQEFEAESFPKTSELEELSPPAKTPKFSEDNYPTTTAAKIDAAKVAGDMEIVTDSVQVKSESFVSEVDISCKIENKNDMSDNEVHEGGEIAKEHSLSDNGEHTIPVAAVAELATIAAPKAQDIHVEESKTTSKGEGLKIDIIAVKAPEEEELHRSQSPVVTGAIKRLFSPFYFIIVLIIFIQLNHRFCV